MIKFVFVQYGCYFVLIEGLNINKYNINKKNKYLKYFLFSSRHHSSFICYHMVNSKQDRGGQVRRFIDAYHLIIYYLNRRKIIGVDSAVIFFHIKPR